ncbi:MAG: DUF2062 domain-containing protein [Gammaproteobacteria bacterium]|nr:DUF2062 domain-containing protein [Gammaproteobacteria bacterium]
MPRKLLKKYIPSEQTLKENKYLQIFGEHILAPNLWHLNKRSVSGAFTVGLFCAFVPIPFQMLLAAGVALIAKVNLPVSSALVWITNPLTMTPIFYFSYLVGTWVLGTPITDVEFSLSIQWLQNELSVIWQPFLLGCLICGTVSAFLGNILVRLMWRYLVVQSWQKRKDKRIT